MSNQVEAGKGSGIHQKEGLAFLLLAHLADAEIDGKCKRPRVSACDEYLLHSRLLLLLALGGRGPNMVASNRFHLILERGK